MDRKDLRYGRPYRMLATVMSFDKGDIVYYCGYFDRGEDCGRLFSRKCICGKGPGLTLEEWETGKYHHTWLVFPYNLEKVSKRELKGER